MAISANYYQFYLGGDLLADDPLNWDSAKIVIERDPTLKGIFINYIENLTFVGDGYSYLFNHLQTTGFCGEVSFEVIECFPDGGRVPDGFSFQGAIDMATVTLRRSKGEVQANIENINLSYLINKYKDLRITINQTGETLNGETLTDIMRSFSWDIPVMASVKGEYVKNLIAYIISYISDNRITFLSDHFQTNSFRPKKVNVQYTASVAMNDTEDVTYTNIYGDTISKTITYTPAGYTSATAAAAPFQYRITQLCYNRERSSNFSDPLVLDKPANGYNYVEIPHVGDIDAGYSHSPSGPSTDTISLYAPYDLQFTSDVAAAVTVVNGFTDGAANLALTTGSYLSGDDERMVISFSDLFKMCDSIHNLQVIYTVADGQPTIRIEPEPYFYDEQQSVEVDHVQHIEERAASDLTYKSLSLRYNVSDVHEDTAWWPVGPNYRVPFVYDKSFTFSGCGTVDRVLDIKPLVFNISQYAGFSPNDQFLFDCAVGSDAAQIAVVTQAHDRVEAGITSHDIESYAYFTPSALPILVLKRHLGVTGINAFNAGEEVEIDNPQLIKRLNNLQATICWSKMKDIIDNAYKYITIKSPCLTIEGYIKKIEYTVASGDAKFELYSR